MRYLARGERILS